MKGSIPPESMLTPGARWYLQEIDDGLIVNEDIDIAATAYTHDGEMLGLVGKNWESYSDALKVEILAHEAGHVSGGHDFRRNDRDPQLWNIVADAGIHYSGGVAPWAVEELHGVTYDALGIPPVPIEIAYDMLKGSIPNNPQMGCGRHNGPQGEEEMSADAKNRALVAAIRGAAAVGQLGSKEGRGIVVPEVLPSFPNWIHEVLERLKKSVAYDDPQRRWIKETRRDVDPIMLPGRAARLGVACTFVGDASGSMIDPDTLSLFFGAVEATPELANSEFVIFSDHALGPVPVREWRKIFDQCSGGGTSFQAGAKLRRPGVPSVWLTDGYTGDGWPEPHDSDEFWVISTDVVPPHGVRIQA